MPDHKINTESGNAIFYVIIGVALLAALSVAVMRGGGGSTDKLSEDQKNLYASEIITYADNISNAVAQIRLRGTPVESISFASENTTDYGTFNNDPRNEVFNPGGGGIIYKEPPEGALTSAFTQYEFLSGNEIEDIGTTCASDDCVDLLFYIPNIDTDVCIIINNIATVTNTNDEPPITTSIDTDEQFAGSFTYQGTVAGDSNELANKKEGCIITTSGATSGHYYRVLSAR